jgi:hypothetical protein
MQDVTLNSLLCKNPSPSNNSEEVKGILFVENCHE